MNENEVYKISDLKTKIVDNDFATRFVSKYHYTKTCSNIVVAIGQWLDLDLKSVVVFNYCSGREMANQVIDGGSNDNTLELSRLVSFEPKPKNLESYAISQALKWLKENMPNIKVVISYADNSVGHHGYIYQASNFIYYGQSRQTIEWYLDGERIHERVLNSRYGTSSLNELKKVLGDKISYIKNNLTKSRYYILLSQNKKERKELMKKIKVKPLEYPKGDNKNYNIFLNGNFSTSDKEKQIEETKKDLTRQLSIFDL